MFAITGHLKPEDPFYTSRPVVLFRADNSGGFVIQYPFAVPVRGVSRGTNLNDVNRVEVVIITSGDPVFTCSTAASSPPLTPLLLFVSFAWFASLQ